ncbi:MAG: dolichyl-phosphate beta-glucosyltransferase [Planctomycetota bacterium]|nr:dolichyl-phosphate beta-glucosyltransferase [Planctomycetota bacterium]
MKVTVPRREQQSNGYPSDGPADKPLLSVVIPAHNEQARLPGTLEEVFSFLSVQPYSSEVLVVENGSEDQTLKVAQSFMSSHPSLRVLQESRRGKGLAVRRGMLEARGQYRFLCDADLSMPIAEVNQFLPPLLKDFDIAIGSREAPGAVVDQPVSRRRIGRTFNAIVRLMALPGLRDTQCGFKCFRAAVAEDIFSRQRLEGMAFDVEVLRIARHRGYRIIERPITWRFDPDSRVRLFRDSMRMVAELLTIRRNARRGLYDD